MNAHAPTHDSPQRHDAAATHGPHRNYFKIWLILVGLLIVSVIGPMTGIRTVMLITAFGVALVKAYLVAKNFMHLDVEKPIVHWTLGLALTLMVLMYAGIAPDVQKSSGDHWKKGPGFHPKLVTEAAETRHADEHRPHTP